MAGVLSSEAWPLLPRQAPCSAHPSACPCAPLSSPCQAFTQENLDFQEKVLLRSGLGEETYLPECELAVGVWRQGG